MHFKRKQQAAIVAQSLRVGETVIINGNLTGEQYWTVESSPEIARTTLIGRKIWKVECRLCRFIDS